MSPFLRTRLVLAVPDLARSTAYWRDQLGLALQFETEGWSFLGQEGFTVMLGDCPQALPVASLGDHSYVAYLTVRDAAALHATYAARGVEFTKPLSDEPWGMREFGVRTVDGHRLMFGQQLD